MILNANFMYRYSDGKKTDLFILRQTFKKLRLKFLLLNICLAQFEYFSILYIYLENLSPFCMWISIFTGGLPSVLFIRLKLKKVLYPFNFKANWGETLINSRQIETRQTNSRQIEVKSNWGKANWGAPSIFVPKFIFTPISNSVNRSRSRIITHVTRASNHV